MDRLEEELIILRSVFPRTSRDGSWFLIPDYSMPESWGWTPNPMPIAFHAQPNHPGQQPYGIYLPMNARVRGNVPGNRADAGNRPPFAGEWAILSWTPQGGEWRPKGNARDGANLLTYALGFRDRFAEGS